jgi:drug/metabolite transporter (DMT)-like permease
MNGLQSSFAWVAGLPGAVRGTLWMTLAAILFTGIPISVRMLSDHMGPAEIIFFRSVLGMAFMAPYFLWTGRSPLRTNVLKLHVQRSAINFFGMMLWFYALALIPLGQAVALHFTMPLFIVLLAALFLGERVDAGRWVATVTGFAGMLIVLRPGIVEVGLPSLAVLGSALLYGVAVTTIKVLTRTERAAVITFYSHLIMLVLAVVPTVAWWGAPVFADTPYLLMLAVCGTIAPFAVTRALHVMDASVVAPLDFLRLPFVAAAGFFLFAEIPDRWTIIGALVIIGATTNLARREATAARRGASS